MTPPTAAAAPARRVAAPPEGRPGLRLVRPPPRRARAVLFLSTAVVFAVLLLSAILHTTIVSGQRDLDQVEVRIEEGTRRNQTLRLRTAELQSPARVVESATADGMDVPDGVTWLSPDPQGEVASSTDGPDPSDRVDGSESSDDVRAGADPAAEAAEGAPG